MSIAGLAVAKSEKKPVVVLPKEPTARLDNGHAEIDNKVIKGSIIKPKYKQRYKKNGGTCGDDIAGELEEYLRVVRNGKLVTDMDKLRQVAEDNKIWVERYGLLNPGQRRMTIGNKLRSLYEQGERIDIGGAILFKEFEDIT